MKNIAKFDKSGAENLEKTSLEQAGDPACWLHLVCPDCQMIMESDAHVCLSQNGKESTS
jgi:hypothetical protein